MPKEIPEADYERIWNAARILRTALRAKRMNANARGPSQRQIKDYAAFFLQECVLQEWVPPAGLVTLVTDLLDEGGPIPIAPPNVFDIECPRCGGVAPMAVFNPRVDPTNDLTELLAKHLALGPQIAAHIERINTVGMRGFEKAAAFEASYPEDTEEGQPSTATISEVARKASVSRDSIRRWRKSYSYRSKVTRLRNST